jgi:hypothetical protein
MPCPLPGFDGLPISVFDISDVQARLAQALTPPGRPPCNMKTSFAILSIALIGIAAFLMGREKSNRKSQADISDFNTRTASSQAGAIQQAPATTNRKSKLKSRTGPGVLSTEEAGLLTSEERIALLRKAALLADPEKQADILCGLISAMTQDELTETTKVLLDAQRRGNG